MQNDRINDTDDIRLLINSINKPVPGPLIKAASRLTGNPALYISVDKSVLEMYPRSEIGQPIWDALLSGGTKKHSAIDVLSRLLDEETANQAENIRCINAGKADSMLIGRVNYRSDFAGLLLIYGSFHPVGYEDTAVAEIITEALSTHLRFTRYQNTYPLDDDLTLRLGNLVGAEAPAHVLAADAKEISSHISRYYSIFVSNIDANDHSLIRRTLTGYIETHLMSAAVVRDNCLVVLIGGNDGAEPGRSLKATTQMEDCYKHFRQYGIYGGFSNLFSNASEIHCQYIQAKLTAKLVDIFDIKKLCFFSEMMPMHFFLPVAEQFPRETFIHPMLEDIKEYDKDHGTQYHLTIREYCLSMFNKNNTAKALGIHKNTLLYRLVRIREIFDLEFDLPANAIHLLCSFYLEDLLLALNK